MHISVLKTKVSSISQIILSSVIPLVQKGSVFDLGRSRHASPLSNGFFSRTFPWWASLQKWSSNDSMLDFMTFQSQNWHWHLSRSPFCSDSANLILVEKVTKNEQKWGQILFPCPSALQICFFSTESPHIQLWASFVFSNLQSVFIQTRRHFARF